MRLELRYLIKSDTVFLHKLRCDPEVMKNSRNQREIPFDKHKEWVDQAITNSNVVPMVIWIGDKRAGQLNLTKSTCTICEISISLMPEFRGYGFAEKALKIAHNVAKDEKYRNVLAEVKKTNVGSLRLFTEAGYNAYFEKENSIILIKEV